MRFAVALASWVVAAILVEGVLGGDIDGAGHRLRDRIEMQLKGGGGGPPRPSPQPERTHEDAMEPWELVSC
jgi:hypothetical protein